MSKIFDQSFINDLLVRVDIVDVIQAKISLKQAGSNLVGLCPFHIEKTPSFTVNRNKQFFYCFGCKTYGSAISFIMKYENRTFVDVIEILAGQVGLSIQNLHQINNDFSELYDITDKISLFFEKQLIKSTKAISYLKSRKIDFELCKKFKIGYAPNYWDNLKIIYHKYPDMKKHMITTGLLIKKDTNKIYSCFRNRIIFPIKNIHGNIVGFGGRSIENDNSIKYLNSIETPIFHKNEIIYGLYEAKKYSSNLSNIIIVEGYIDVLTMFKYGITNVVATLGTTISTKQIQILLKHTSCIIFCFDGDDAGRLAAWKAVEKVLSFVNDEIQIKFLFLPEKEDPDSILNKESIEKFKLRLLESIPISDFLISNIISNINLNNIYDRVRVIKISKELLHKMPNSIFKQLLLNKISNLLKVSNQDFDNYLYKKEISPKYLSINHDNEYKGISIFIRNTLKILLHYPDLISYISCINDINNIKLKGIDILIELINLIKKNKNISTGVILENWRNRQELHFLEELISEEPIIDKDILKDELNEIIISLRQHEKEENIQEMLMKAKKINLNFEEKIRLQSLIRSLKI